MVYPYSTGRELGPALAQAGLGAIAVRPADPSALGMTGPPLDPAAWWQVVTDPGDLGELAGTLPDVSWVLPGDESGVPVAEELADKLGRPGNDPRTTGARTRKTDMQEALYRAGVPGPETCRATTIGQVRSAASRIGYPVVLKPDWSSSSVGVTVCYSPAALTVAAGQLLGSRGALGEVTRAIAVQERLTGSKWTVDTVTAPGPDGRPAHKITSVWQERVIEHCGHFAWGESWLVAPADLAAITDPQALRVIAYTHRVLDATGVVWGPACTELVLTSTGPRLTEVMARLAGCYPVHLVENVTGQSQVTATVDLLTNPAALASREPAAGDGRAVAQAWLAAPHAGWLNGAELQQIRDLPTVQAISPGLQADAEVEETTDSPTSPGRLDLCGPPAAVQQDIEAIRALEQTLYRRHR
ncbi:MAG TPA: hypothetical protein VHY58_11165 [Streptosporangiaceae bacterium]|nr:hypothetical protein [Streptosporangiaceae bacterium]